LNKWDVKAMSKLLITKYYNQLHDVINAGRTRNETSITFAFANLLRAYAEKKNFQLIEQFEFVGKSGKKFISNSTKKVTRPRISSLKIHKRQFCFRKARK
jgi:hypothetical protein